MRKGCQGTMPQVRKLTPEEILRIEHADRPYQLHIPRISIYERARTALCSPFDETHLTSRPAPRIGDIVTFQDHTAPFEQQGIVLHVHELQNGWIGALLSSDQGQQWVSAERVGPSVGRPRGISRIDQPLRRTHGWFVRIYDQGKPIVARMFSDGKHGNIGLALEAALDFYQSYEPLAQERQVNGQNV